MNLQSIDMNGIPSILKKIVENKNREVFDRKTKVSEADLIVKAAEADNVRGFYLALDRQKHLNSSAIIAEIKKASPSKGILCKDFDPYKYAREYSNAGATCLSVLTDEVFFQGCDSDLVTARKSCGLPVLRKDFVVDQYQIIESRALGADAILIIMAALTDYQVEFFLDKAHSLDLDVVMETHNREEMERALSFPNKIIGINNRNLHTFETNLSTTIDLCKLVPDDRLLITESGIKTAEDVKEMKKAGISAFLIGESLMTSSKPGAALVALLND